MKILPLSLSLLCFSAEARELRVALSDVAPFSYYSGRNITGFHYDIFKQIEKKTGLKFSFSLYPHARINNFLEKENMDLAILTRIICEKSPDMFMASEAIYQNTPTVFIKENNIVVKNPKIARLISTCSSLEKNYPDLYMMDHSSMEQIIDLAIKGRVDGLCGLPPVVNFHISKLIEPVKLNKLYSDDNNKAYEAVLCMKKNLDPKIINKLTNEIKQISLPKNLKR